ncbi:hypothetical protein [Helicobacter rodentium]|uniref:hypothetical protein n=1 Tax=Helicobacter rodentium TaxID=59617 RepID=UPI00047E90FD|nr:hypothetical protein [Helicobacter rodentium]
MLEDCFAIFLIFFGLKSGTDEAIHNQAYFKDSIAESRVDKVMDCFGQSPRNNEVADALVSRHCERSEAIHNVDNQKYSIALVATT